MKYVRDQTSGALIGVPTEEEKRLIELAQVLKAVINVLPKSITAKIDSKILEVLNNV